ncbi:MAG: acetolactate synthase small subunit [Candidatus Dormibacteraeota bacterium]|nr:acetolactate synthase small subunit [Candidatus Dormibacteraeota bacterium]
MVHDRLRLLAVTVENHPGVMSRVSGMIRRRGFNIQTITVGPSTVAGRSRMTLTVDAGYAEVDQVAKQLDRLIEVIAVEDITEASTYSRELLIVRLEKVPPTVEQFGARKVSDKLVELTADTTTIEDFIEFLKPFGIEELARTGPVAMRRTA